MDLREKRPVRVLGQLGDCIELTLAGWDGHDSVNS